MDLLSRKCAHKVNKKSSRQTTQIYHKSNSWRKVFILIFFLITYLLIFLQTKRYGCAQLLKCCGSLPLRSCSLGKLSLFVQVGISRGILIYYKTLLIKPANFNFDEFNNIDILIDVNNESNINNGKGECELKMMDKNNEDKL